MIRIFVKAFFKLSLLRSMYHYFLRSFAIISLLPIISILMLCCDTGEQGMYFTPFDRDFQKLPVFEETRLKLPEPVYDEDPSFIDCYWKAWEIAFNNFYEPPPGSGFVSNYIDAAFTHSNDIFFWDTGFMTMFCNYAHPYVPGIQSMDNFYAKQHPDGEICRQINRDTGKDYVEWVNDEGKGLFSRWGPLYRGGITWDVKYVDRDAPVTNPVLTLDALNHPIAAWIELESYRLTGDVDRLKGIWLPLVKYYEVFEVFLRQGNGLYITDWASMDNSPRNDFLVDGGCGIDISAEMVLYARCMKTVADIIGKPIEAEKYQIAAEELTKLINDRMWSKRDGFYYDLTVDNEMIPIKTVAAFWTLLAEVASSSQAEYLFGELENPNTFNRTHRVPTLSAAEEGYDPLGAYWKGAVWAPTNTMVIRGLEKYNNDELAREIAMNHLEKVVQVYEKTGTLWENYAADSICQGNQALDEFVGWTGIAPVMYLIEYAIGIKADALSNSVYWNINSSNRVGVNNFWFGGKTASLICEKADEEGNRKIMVESDGDFNLIVKYDAKKIIKPIKKGESLEFQL